MKEEKDIALIQSNKRLLKWKVSYHMKSVVATAYRNGQSINISSSLNKWMHFQHVLTSWEFQQITDMLYVR